MFIARKDQWHHFLSIFSIMVTGLQILKMNGALNKKLNDQYLYEIINILLIF